MLDPLVPYSSDSTIPILFISLHTHRIPVFLPPLASVLHSFVRVAGRHPAPSRVHNINTCRHQAHEAGLLVRDSSTFSVHVIRFIQQTTPARFMTVLGRLTREKTGLGDTNTTADFLWDLSHHRRPALCTHHVTY
jgi:hypothetical protein